MRARWLRGSLLGATILMTVWSTTASALITPTLLRGGPGDQFTGMATTDWVIWTSLPSDPGEYAALAQPAAGGPVVQMSVEPRGFSGTVTGDTAEAIYQQVGTFADDSDLYLYDLESDTRDAIDDVNTANWEFSPSASPGYILFTRITRSWRVLLYDRTTHVTTTLASRPADCRCIASDQVSDDLATWTDCGGSRCQVYYYDIGAATVAKVPNPLGKDQYSSSVSSGSGSLYFGRAGSACGANVRIVRWTPGSGVRQFPVAAVPDGYDLAQMFAYADPGDHDDLAFGRVRCRTGLGDVYQVADADTVVAPTGREARGVSDGSRHLSLPGAPPA